MIIGKKVKPWNEIYNTPRDVADAFKAITNRKTRDITNINGKYSNYIKYERNEIKNNKYF